jgi:hypothetical protein
MPHNDHGNGHELVVPECRSQPADTRLLARLLALDSEAQDQWFASCERPQELKTLRDEIKSYQEIRARFFAEYYEEGVKLFRLDVKVTRRLQEIYDGMETAPGPGRGQRIPQGGKLSQLREWGIEFKQAYKYRGILEVQPAETDSYVATCRAENRVPTVNGLLNATRQRQMLERNVRDRPWTEDRPGLFGSNVSEGDPSLLASAHETIRRSCEEDQLLHVAAILAEMPERRSEFVKCLIDRRQLDNFVQGSYERRGRPVERRRFEAQLHGLLLGEEEPDSTAPTNSSERDETTQPEITADVVAIAADTTDAATAN